MKSDADPSAAVPHVWLEVLGKDAFYAPSGYALTLELGQRKDGKVSGKIYLSMLDDQKTVLAGTFEAVYVRAQTEPPGPDDAPGLDAQVGADLGVDRLRPGVLVLDLDVRRHRALLDDLHGGQGAQGRRRYRISLSS